MDPLIVADAVSKAYEGFALRDVSFTLPRGYIMGLIGPNGAGKTTLIKMMLGLARRDGGELRVLGNDPGRDDKSGRARIGFLHEASSYPPYVSVVSLASMVARFYPSWNHETFFRLTRALGVPTGTRVGALSRGTRNKFGLCLALAHHPDLLLLDEPTTGLDPLARREVLEILTGFIAEGRTSVLFSTHVTADLERVADYITFLQRGRLVFSSTRDEVLDRWGLVRGAPGVLDETVCRAFRGFERGAHVVTGLTDDIADTRRAFAGRDVVIERATLEDIMYYTGRSC